MRKLLFATAALLALGSSSCSDQGNDGNSDTDGSGGGGASSSTGGAGGDSQSWQALFTADWELEPFSEKTTDVHTLVVDRDIYVGAIRPISPKGTHHALLQRQELGTLHTLYASGINTNALTFPAGVGLKLEAGDTLLLELHLLNPSGETLTGTSGIEIVEVAPEDIQQEADVFLPGPMTFEIPPLQSHTETGTCTVLSMQSYFALLPHMHQIGTRLKTTVTIGGETRVLHDGDYDFESQVFLPLDTVTLHTGDTITTECTWNNTTSHPVGWGTSSLDEMCFSILYRYPKIIDAAGDFCDGSMQ